MASKSTQKWNHKWSKIALDNSSYSVFWISENGKIERYNESFAKIIGSSLQKLPDFTLFDLDENLSKKAWKGLWSDLLKSKSELVETVIPDQNGAQCAVELNFTLIEEKGFTISSVLR